MQTLASFSARIKEISLKHEEQSIMNSVLKLLYGNSLTYENLQELWYKKFIIKDGKKLRGKNYPKKKKRVLSSFNSILNLLVEKNQVIMRNSQYYLTNSGEEEAKELLRMKPVNRISNPLVVATVICITYFTVTLLKIEGFMISNNLIFIADLISSFFGVGTLTIINYFSGKRYNSIIRRTWQILSIMFGISVIILGFVRIINPVSFSNLSSLIPLITLLVCLFCFLFLYIYFSIDRNDLKLRIYELEVKSKILNPIFVVIAIFGVQMGFNFGEGLIILIFGINILAEARKVTMNRYSEHILIMLNDHPHSIEEIIEIDSRIAMLFGAPMFFSDERSIKHLWYNQLGIENLLMKGYIIQKNGLFELTSKGRTIADEKVKGMISFLRFITSLTNPKLSPILSLIVHLVLGTLKISGFLITGSIGLLGDGIDSTLDGVSAIIVGITMKIKKEIYSTYILLLMMVISGLGILFSSLNRIVNPIPLEEENLAIGIALLSIVICLLLYLYQRYSGYINQNLTILTQSEDSKNHVLNAVLVLIAVSAEYLQIYIFDGIVGCFIGLLILKGAYNLSLDLRSIQQGEDIDFSKYKLGVWKAYNKFRYKMIKNWILYQILKNIDNEGSLCKSFNQTFRSILITHSQGDSFRIDSGYTIKDFQFELEKLIRSNLVDEREGVLSLTESGERTILREITRFNH